MVEPKEVKTEPVAPVETEAQKALSRGHTVEVLDCINPKGRKVSVLKSAFDELKDAHLWKVLGERVEPDYNFRRADMESDTLSGWARKKEKEAAARIAARRERA